MVGMTHPRGKEGRHVTFRGIDDVIPPRSHEETDFEDDDSSTSLHKSVSTLSDYIAAGYVPEKPCFMCRLRHPEETLTRLCRCTTLLVHQECWESWLASSGEDKCPLCGEPYKLRRHSPYSALGGLWVWSTGHASKVQMLTLLLLAAAATDAVLLGLHVARAKSLSWLALLASASLVVQAAVLRRLWSKSHVSFSRWLAGTTTVTLLEPPAEDR
ncbi:uncharacterized protein LOC134531438 [Bacillus rossius redtenbacheri]|uniref:uncharacterized protein LOC134531438 n=1 Tax=Bacillus rossius redtenbacheri TaxID=93214 RepID=UPI002FDD8D52